MGSEDREKRSEWVNEKEGTVEVFAFPLPPLDSFRGFVEDYRVGTRDRSIAQAQSFPLGSLEAARSLERDADEKGRPFQRIVYLVHESGGHDVHMVTLAVLPEELSETERELQSHLRSSRWVETAARRAPKK